MEIILNVKGMVCGGCEKRVKNSLKELKEVKKVKADYKNEKVTVVLKEEIDKKILEDKIEDLGFSVVKED